MTFRELQSFGQRLTWARAQKGWILKKLSEETGLAIGYLSQLEKGAKVNPTKEVVDKLAAALGISPAFLLGEVVPGPVTDAQVVLAGGVAEHIGKAFRQHYLALPQGERDSLALSSLAKDQQMQPFKVAVDFLRNGYSLREFMVTDIAYAMGLSVRAVNDVLERGCGFGPGELERFAMTSGIPMSFLCTGMFSETEVSISSELILRFTPALVEAVRKGLSPEQLLHLVRKH